MSPRAVSESKRKFSLISLPGTYQATASTPTATVETTG